MSNLPSPVTLELRKAVLDLAMCGEHTEDIAKALNITRRMVVTIKQKRRDRQKKSRIAVRMTQAGKKRIEVAKALGVSPGYLRSLLCEEGLLDPSRVAGGKKGRKMRDQKHAEMA